MATTRSREKLLELAREKLLELARLRLNAHLVTLLPTVIFRPLFEP